MLTLHSIAEAMCTVDQLFDLELYVLASFAILVTRSRHVKTFAGTLDGRVWNSEVTISAMSIIFHVKRKCVSFWRGGE